MSDIQDGSVCYKVRGDLVLDGNDLVSSRASYLGGIFLRRALNALQYDSSKSVCLDVAPPSPTLNASNNFCQPTTNSDPVTNTHSPSPRVRKFGHRKLVKSVCFSPDGTMLATGSKDKIARIFDTATGKMIFKSKELGSLVSGLNSVVFSPDGKCIATGSGDGFARVFDIRTGLEILKTFKHGSSLCSVNSVAFSPDGKCLATGSHDKFARIFLVKNGREMLKTKMHGGYLTSVCFSPNGNCIVTACSDSFVRFFDIRDGKELLKPIKHAGPVFCICFSPDGNVIASGGSEKIVRIFHSATGHEIFKISDLQGEVMSLSFSPGAGKNIAVACGDRSVHIHDVNSGKIILQNIEHGDYVTSVAFSPDGKRIATGSKDHVARIFDLQSGKACISSFEPDSTIKCFCLSPDGRRLAIAYSDNIVHIFDINSGRKILQTIAHGHTIVSLCFSPDSQSILTGSHDHFARLFDVSSGDQTLKLIDDATEYHSGSIQNKDPIVNYYWTHQDEKGVRGAHVLHPIVFHSRNQLSPVKLRHHAEEGGYSDVLPVIECHFNTIRMSLDHKNKVTHVCFSSDGLKIATGCFDKLARIFDVPSQKLLATISHEGQISSVGFSADGLGFITSYESVFRIFDISSGVTISKTIVVECKCTHACFLPNDQMVAAGGDDGIVRIFDVSTGEETSRTSDHRGAVTQIWFSPDLDHFATSSSDNYLRIFPYEKHHHQSQSIEVNACMILSGKLFSFSWHDSAWRMSFWHNNRIHVILRPLSITNDAALPMSSDLVLLWSNLDPDLQRQWFFNDNQVVLSEFVVAEGGPLVTLASKCYDAAFPNASATLKRLCETDEPVVNAGLILSYLLNGPESGFCESGPDAQTIHALLCNVGKHMHFACHDAMLIHQIIRAGCMPGLKHFIHKFWTEIARPVPSHPISIRNVNQVTFSRSTRMYVSGSDIAFEPVFENYFSKHPQAKGISLDFEHWLVPFQNPFVISDIALMHTASVKANGGSTQLPDTANIVLASKKKKSFVELLVETNDIDSSAAFLMVRALVQFKWQMYGLRHWLKEFYIYTVNLALLLALSMMIWQEPLDNTIEIPPKAFAVGVLIAALDIRNLYRELKQFIHGIPINDGKTSLVRRVLSSSHYAHGREFWNWVELIHIGCGVSVVVLLFAKSPDVTPALAVTCFLRWWGLLFYIQAFDKTGVYVSMIVEIVKAIRWFLFIMLLSGMAHWNSFVLLLKKRCNEPDSGSDCELPHDVVSAAKSMIETVMWLLFMTGDVLALENTDHKGLVIVIFFISMIAVPLILINMLIAIMGDSYLQMRSRSLVESVMLKASIILEIELFMTDTEKSASAYMPKYLHAIVPAGEANIMDDGIQGFREEISKLKKQIATMNRHSAEKLGGELKAFGEGNYEALRTEIKQETHSLKEQMSRISDENKTLQKQLAEALNILHMKAQS